MGLNRPYLAAQAIREKFAGSLAKHSQKALTGLLWPF